MKSQDKVGLNYLNRKDKNHWNPRKISNNYLVLPLLQVCLKLLLFCSNLINFRAILCCRMKSSICRQSLSLNARNSILGKEHTNNSIIRSNEEYLSVWRRRSRRRGGYYEQMEMKWKANINSQNNINKIFFLDKSLK